MVPSMLIWLLLMVLGYIVPAYECFKAVERNRRDVEQLRFWCQYWIIIAAFTAATSFTDFLASWVPFYGEAKVAFVFYLWNPQTKGASYVFATFLRPFLQKHEPEIDRHVSEWWTIVRDAAIIHWQKAAAYLSERFMEALRYVVSQGALAPADGSQPVGQKRSTKVRRPSTVADRQARVVAKYGNRTPVLSDEEEYIDVDGSSLDEQPTRMGNETQFRYPVVDGSPGAQIRSRAKNTRVQ